MGAVPAASEDIVGKTDEEIWRAENADATAKTITRHRRPGPIEFVEPVTHADGVHSWLIYKFPIVEGDK